MAQLDEVVESDLLEQVQNLTTEQVARLYMTGIGREDTINACRIVQEAGCGDGYLLLEIEHAIETIRRSMSSAANSGLLSAMRPQAILAAEDAAVNAVIALAFRGRIRRDTFHVLYGPWERVMGRFGPNTEAVEELIERVRRLTLDEARSLRATSNTRSDLEFDIYGARNEAYRVAKGVTRDETLQATWSSAWDNATDRALVGDLDVAENEAWMVAKSVARDALLALMYKDLISDAHFELLYDTWKSAMAAEQ
ncbi:MAG: hypothetical protein ACYCTG_00750 [Ferrimicrobium sp.]